MTVALSRNAKFWNICDTPRKGLSRGVCVAMPFDLLTVSALKGFVLLCTVYGLTVRAINGIASNWLLLNICWRVCYNRRWQMPYALGTLIAT